MWSTAKNIHIKNAVRIPELTGYIKDMAWSYEKEIRIKAEFDNVYGVHRIAIPLTEDLINAMTITVSPLFEGSFWYRNLHTFFPRLCIHTPHTNAFFVFTHKATEE